MGACEREMGVASVTSDVALFRPCAFKTSKYIVQKKCFKHPAVV